MTKYDVTILTQKEYINPQAVDNYLNNVLLEDKLVVDAIKKLGHSVTRVGWDDKSYNWSETSVVLIRGIWDYFERFDEFKPAFKNIASATQIVNPAKLIWWNIDKHYLQDLALKGINIVSTSFIEAGDEHSLESIFQQSGYKKAIVKPAVSGTARHTYILEKNNVTEIEAQILHLRKKEAFLLQPFVNSITSKGEVSHMLFDGEYSHSVLKKAKAGDFRVQDDFGGTIHDYKASEVEVGFAQKVVDACEIKPLYARVDVVWDNDDNLALAELEVIEPELWFRKNPEAADLLARGISREVRK